MASVDSTQDVHTTEQFHGRASDDGDSPAAKASARKDRPCPFCKQPFTSSSLGRHLDLYIKEKNPKPPDGLHNVDQIRKMRSNITRRHTRGSNANIAKRANAEDGSSTPKVDSGARRSYSTPASSVQPSAHDRQADAINSLNSPALELNPATRILTTLNRANWQSTGVINDLPPRAGTLNPYMRKDGPTQHEQLRFDFEAKQKLLDEQDQRYATELALKEVLECVNAARERLSRKDVFDFDFWGTNFPGLCLRILEVPSTLFTTMATITEGSWPVQDPPGSQEADQLRQIVARKTACEDDAMQVRYMKHLNSTYSYWSSLSNVQQRDIYSVEVMRAFASALRSQQETARRLDKALQDASRLRSQLQLFREAVVQSAPPWLKSSSLPADLFNIGEGQQEDGDLEEHLVKEIIKDNESAAAGTEDDMQRTSGTESNPRKRRRSEDDGDEVRKETKHATLKGWDFDSIVNKWSSVVKTRRKSLGTYLSTSTALPEQQSRGVSVEQTKASLAGSAHASTHVNSLAEVPNLQVAVGPEPPKIFRSEVDFRGGSISSGRAPAGLARSGVLDIHPTRHSRGPMQWFTGDRKQAESKSHKHTNGGEQHDDRNDEYDEEQSDEDATEDESSDEDTEMNDGDEQRRSPRFARDGYS